MKTKIMECIENRFSCRNFKDEAITKDELNQIIKAGILAPTACNFQPERIYVISNEDILLQLKDVTKYTFNAKNIIVICYDENVSWKRRLDNKEYGEVDATIVATHMVLEAESLGIGTCFVASFDEAKLRKILKLDENIKPVLMIPLGYPKEKGVPNSRKRIEDLVIYK